MIFHFFLHYVILYEEHLVTLGHWTWLSRDGMSRSTTWRQTPGTKEAASHPSAFASWPRRTRIPSTSSGAKAPWWDPTTRRAPNIPCWTWWIATKRRSPLASLGCWDGGCGTALSGDGHFHKWHPKKNLAKCFHPSAADFNMFFFLCQCQFPHEVNSAPIFASFSTLLITLGFWTLAQWLSLSAEYSWARSRTHVWARAQPGWRISYR